MHNRLFLVLFFLLIPFTDLNAEARNQKLKPVPPFTVSAPLDFRFPEYNSYNVLKVEVASDYSALISLGSTIELSLNCPYNYVKGTFDPKTNTVVGKPFEPVTVTVKLEKKGESYQIESFNSSGIFTPEEGANYSVLSDECKLLFSDSLISSARHTQIYKSGMYQLKDDDYTELSYIKIHDKFYLTKEIQGKNHSVLQGRTYTINQHRQDSNTYKYDGLGRSTGFFFSNVDFGPEGASSRIVFSFRDYKSNLGYFGTSWASNTELAAQFENALKFENKINPAYFSNFVNVLFKSYLENSSEYSEAKFTIHYKVDKSSRIIKLIPKSVSIFTKNPVIGDDETVYVVNGEPDVLSDDGKKDTLLFFPFTHYLNAIPGYRVNYVADERGFGIHFYTPFSPEASPDSLIDFPAVTEVTLDGIKYKISADESGNLSFKAQ
jgi:hypothetical protein